jgi:hypothetical protein
MERKEGSFQIFKKEVILEPIKGKCAVFSRFQQTEPLKLKERVRRA